MNSFKLENPTGSGFFASVCEPFLVERQLWEYFGVMRSYKNFFSEWSQLALSWLPLMALSSWLSGILNSRVPESLRERAWFDAGVSVEHL